MGEQPHNAGQTVTVRNVVDGPVSTVDFGTITVTENWGRLFLSKSGVMPLTVLRSAYPALIAAIQHFISPALDAAEARAGVKPLVFGIDGKTHFASTVLGEYRVANIHGEWIWLLAWMPKSNEDKIDQGAGEKNSAKSAKAAAQADYEARILSALHPATHATLLAAALVPEVAALVKALRLAEHDQIDFLHVCREFQAETQDARKKEMRIMRSDAVQARLKATQAALAPFAREGGTA